MNKLLISLVLLLSPFFVATAAPKIDNPITAPTFDIFLQDILEVIVRLGAMILVIMLIYSGYLFITAQGKDEELQKAKNAFKWTVIGGVILIGATAIAAAITGTMNLL